MSRAAMSEAFYQHLRDELGGVRASGLYKSERILEGPQGAAVTVRTETAGGAGRSVLNFCANNYLGLANHPALVRAAHAALDRWGLGLASVRFVCGTQEIHQELERKLSGFLGVQDTLLYSSCFDANGGVFDALLTEADTVVSDELNHASIINGIRLSKARRYRYRNGDLADLEARLREAAAAASRFTLIVTDGVFSLEGTIAPLPDLCALGRRYGALVMVDDSHAVGILGPNGRGSPEHCGVEGQVDILTGTLGKALGGANGGYVAGRRELIDLLRQRSRPYLFSNALPPAIVAAAIAAVDLVTSSPALREKLSENTRAFRAGLARTGLPVPPGVHPIVPIILGEAGRAQAFAARMFERGVYATSFSYPLVPAGTARLRLQISAAHEPAQLEFALEALAATRRELGP
jgi:glycine C-acetyltransferase